MLDIGAHGLILLKLWARLSNTTLLCILFGKFQVFGFGRVVIVVYCSRSEVRFPIHA